MFGISRQGESKPWSATLAAAVLAVGIAAPAFAQTNAPDGAKKEGESRATPELPPTQDAPPPPRVGDKISLSAGLDFSSHFISFGADVWGGGADNQLPFKPDSTSFLYGTATAKFTDDLSGFANIWSDINDNTDSGIGGNIQEIDINTGFTYTTHNDTFLDKFTFGIAHNYWIYGGDEEKALEASVGYNDADAIFTGFGLNPSFLAHYRYDGIFGQPQGFVFQVGVRPTFVFNKESDYPITLAVPAAVAFFTDSYQGGDSGFGYANLGLSASVPLAFIPQGYGAWTAAVTATGWYTPDYAIPGNPDEFFLVTALSIGVSF